MFHTNVFLLSFCSDSSFSISNPTHGVAIMVETPFVTIVANGAKPAARWWRDAMVALEDASGKGKTLEKVNGHAWLVDRHSHNTSIYRNIARKFYLKESKVNISKSLFANYEEKRRESVGKGKIRDGRSLENFILPCSQV